MPNMHQVHREDLGVKGEGFTEGGGQSAKRPKRKDSTEMQAGAQNKGSATAIMN